MTKQADGVVSFTPEQIENGRVLFAGVCDFIAGVQHLDQLPPLSFPEVAFAGRSNVGKSSLINAITGRNALARVSHTPGRTQQLNFFNIGRRMMLVDMPGYGYAKVSKSMVIEWTKLLKSYLKGRATLARTCVLVDSRHGFKESDFEMMKMLDEAAVSYIIVLTKVDEITGAALAEIQGIMANELKKHPAAYPTAFPTSSEKGTGIAELRAFIAGLANRA